MKYKNYILATLAILLFQLESKAQCAMCRAVLESDVDGAAAEGINNGIVYLMIFPYLLIGVIGYFIYKARREAKQEKTA